MGKGSTRRPNDMDAYRAGWDRLFRALADLDAIEGADIYYTDAVEFDIHTITVDKEGDDASTDD